MNKCRELPMLIDSKREEVKRLKELAMSIPSADPSREYVSGGPQIQCRHAELIEKAIDLELEICADIDELLDHKRKAREQIEAVEDATYRTFLTYYYLDCLDIEEIAERMNYSVRHIYRIKAESRHLMSQENVI